MGKSAIRPALESSVIAVLASHRRKEEHHAYRVVVDLVFVRLQLSRGFFGHAQRG